MVEQPDDDLEALTRLRHALPGLFALAGGAASRASAETEATDSTGTIRVRFDADHLPAAVSVGDGWRRAVGAEGFAAAVTEAFTNAMLASFAATDASDNDRLIERIGAHVDYVVGAAPPPPELPVRVPTVDPQELASEWYLPLVEQTFAAADATGSDDQMRALTEEPTGEAGQGRLTLSGAVAVSCAADPEWVSRQETAELNEALATALATLRARHHQQSAPWRRIAEVHARLSDRETGRAAGRNRDR